MDVPFSGFMITTSGAPDAAAPLRNRILSMIPTPPVQVPGQPPAGASAPGEARKAEKKRRPAVDDEALRPPPTTQFMFRNMAAAVYHNLLRRGHLNSNHGFRRGESPGREPGFDREEPSEGEEGEDEGEAETEAEASMQVMEEEAAVSTGSKGITGRRDRLW